MEYVGQELELFAAAHNWKSYLRDRISPFLGREVLEVGAGIGATARLLISNAQSKWVCIEPDEKMAAQLRQSIAGGSLPEICTVRTGTLADVPQGEDFDSIIYVDVLEHIEQDSEELARAAARLKPGGYVVVLSPAHQWLFSEFDQALGHYRRYSAGSLTAAAPAGLRLARLEYLDSVGVLASAANKILLRSSMPTRKQIAVWDRIIVPASRILDPIFGRKVGKSILGVWQRAIV